MTERCERVLTETLGRVPAFWKVREGYEITEEMDDDWIKARLVFYDGRHWRMVMPPHRVIPQPTFGGCRIEAMK